MADSRNAANIRFDDVGLAPTALSGQWTRAGRCWNRCWIAVAWRIAAEMMGCALEAFERTVAYLKEREQFGVPIGTFQALQHRAAHMQAEIELCRSVVLQALSAVDDDTGAVAAAGQPGQGQAERTGKARHQ